MGLNSFTRDHSIFENETVLRDEYTPDDLLERDDELAAYQNALRPVINGAPPKNIFLYGQTGVGKTISTDLVLSQLRSDAEQYDDLGVETIYLNCKDLSTSYQVAANLVNVFRADDPDQSTISTTGYPQSMVYDMLWEHLEALDGTHALIVLDEVDSIGTDDGILYQLPRASTAGHVTDTYVGVIGICNNFTFRDNLSARVKDTLCEEELHFKPYDANQLGTILRHRAEKAFFDDVLESDVIPAAAAYGAQESGSARQALKLLYKAGDLAREAERSTVTGEDVENARELIAKDRIGDEVNSLPTQGKLALTAVYTLERRGETPSKRIQIHDEYERHASAIDADVLSIRSIHDRLSDLRLKGILDGEERNDGRSGGSYYQYQLGDREDIIGEILQEDERLSALF